MASLEAAVAEKVVAKVAAVEAGCLYPYQALLGVVGVYQSCFKKNLECRPSRPMEKRRMKSED
jgi:hypothetical protein